MRSQIRNRAARPTSIRPEFTQVGNDTIIASTTWFRPDGSRQERYQVLMLRDGTIADIQGCASKRQAERFARRR